MKIFKKQRIKLFLKVYYVIFESFKNFLNVI